MLESLSLERERGALEEGLGRYWGSMGEAVAREGLLVCPPQGGG